MSDFKAKMHQNPNSAGLCSRPRWGSLQPAYSQSINQSIRVICNACNVVHKLESEARAVASGRVLRIVIEKVGLEESFERI